MEVNMTPKEKILNLLRDGDVKTIVLAGESGIGKTWTAREISYHAVENKLFDFTLWAFLTEEYDTAIPPDNEALPETKALSESKVLLESIARQLSLIPTLEEYEVEQDDDVEAEEEEPDDFQSKWDKMQAMIAKKLDRKTVLLIVEVIVRSELNEEQIVDGFKTLLKLKPESFFKVLITRTHSVTQSTSVIELEPLSADEFLALLSKKAGPLWDNPAIQDSVKLFVEKLKRLPSAIPLLGKALSSFEKDCDSAVRMLNGVLEEASDDESYDISRLLRSKYKMLPRDTRSVLMDCSWKGKHFFRECGSVHYNELIAYWMVEGLLGRIDSIEEAYEEGHRVLMELIDYQVLKTLDDGYVKMDATKLNLPDHRRLGFCATATLGLATVSEGKTEVFGKITQADGVMKTICSREREQILSTLMVDGNRFSWEELLQMLQTNKKLQVLALFKRKLESLLSYLSELLNLRVLLLRECVSQGNITPFLELQNLIVLEISGTSSLNELPNEFFTQMPLIQSLNLSSLPINSLPPSFCGLTKLVWLILRGCVCLKNLESLKAMENLVVLDLSGSTSFNHFKDKTFSSNPRLQMLNFSNTAIKCIPLVRDLGELTHLLVSGCKKMDRLRKMETLTGLRVLDLSGSSIFNEFHDQALENKDHLEILDLSGTDIMQLPSDISDHHHLYLKGCKQLKELPFLEKLKGLEVLDVSGSVCLNKIQDNFFDNLEKLRIVKLSQTGIKTLPSLSNVLELRELLLSNCSNLEGLPDLKSLIKLEVLDVSGCTALKVIQDETFEQMSRLRKLDLSETKIESLLSISSLSNLRQLLLRNCTELKEVPPLDSQSKLEELNLHGVRSFGGAGAYSLKNMRGLVILDLSETSIEELPSLSIFPDLTQLSLAGCSLLKTVPDLESLTKLEVLDLSGTKITFLPSLESFNNLRQLLLRDCSSLQEFINVKILDMFGANVEELPYGISKMKNLERVELPENKDIHVAEEQEEDTDQCLWRIFSCLSKYSVSISNARFVQLLTADPSLWDSSFSNFHFCIEPVKGQYKSGNQHVDRNEIALLRDICFSRFQGEPTLEICGFEHPPKGLEDILNRTDCLYLVENMFERWLSSLGAANLKRMKGCWLEGCKEMETVFRSEEKDEVALVGKTLESLSVSRATKLKSIYDGDVSAFSSLEYLYLDCCPALSVVFPSSQLPESLKVIHIKFCDKFETLFGNCRLPNLETLHLWELPKLKSIIGCEFPSIKTLRISGCPSLVNVLSSKHPTNVLEILEVCLCEKLANLFENGTSMDNKLPNLKMMNLTGLPEFKSIGCTLPSLQTLKVWGCPLLVNIFSSPQRLEDLEILQVGYCDEMATLINHGASMDYNLPRLKTLHLQELPKMQNFGAKLLLPEDNVINGCPNAETLNAQT